ncbi:hypothetical protein B7P43_G13335 [Cryptotermes secundus]|uniref:Uncharacterized protein n=1 Tax=Cryptotermes secundus TaxID=105785 RepID=A0A2J7R7B4_9NEOP|nr:hypothetical protein B7P43_G13335 [Cryptotermes secundus]
MEIKKSQQEDKERGKEKDRESENSSEGDQTMRTCEGVVGGEGSKKQQMSTVRCKEAVSANLNKCKIWNNVIDTNSKDKEIPSTMSGNPLQNLIHTYIHRYIISQIHCPETGLDIEFVSKMTLQNAV